jgi:hypothetical protein
MAHRLARPGLSRRAFQAAAATGAAFLPLVMLTDPELFPAYAPLVLAFLVLQREWRSGLATDGVR